MTYDDQFRTAFQAHADRDSLLAAVLAIYLTPVLGPINAAMIDWCMDIYEVNGVFKDPDVVLSSLKQARALLPAARLAVHFTPLDEGQESYGLVDFHAAQEQADLNALFFQCQAWNGVDAATARLQDFTRRLMAGFHNYPILSHGVIDFENTTSKTYRGQMGESEAKRITDAMVGAPLEPDEGVYAVAPTGFMDGGDPSILA